MTKKLPRTCHRWLSNPRSAMRHARELAALDPVDTRLRALVSSAQIGARFEEMNREGMAQRMRIDRFGDAAAKARLSAGKLNGVGGDRLAEIPGEEPLSGVIRIAGGWFVGPEGQ
jgi:hypothetical protein